MRWSLRTTLLGFKFRPILQERKRHIRGGSHLFDVERLAIARFSLCVSRRVRLVGFDGSSASGIEESFAAGGHASFVTGKRVRAP